ncbi:MAG: cytochrome ubiquinol oxidase subunit I, partial [Candidatus Hodarchaeales archaeon]
MAVDPNPAITLMSVVFSLHIVLVNIDVGIAVLIPILKRWGEVKNKDRYISHSKLYMRYFAITYASAGVFATAFTVFILTFFPDFLHFLGIALLIPYGFVVLLIALRLFCLSAYWYGWDRFNPKTHFGIGLVLASTSFLIPFFFRIVFGFLNTPDGMVSTDPVIVDPIALMWNPTFLPIFLKSIFGAFALTFFMLVFVYTLKIVKNIGDAQENKDFQILYLKLGFVPFMMMFLFGIWYLLSIWVEVPYKFDNIMGPMAGVDPEAGYVPSILFMIKILFILVQTIAVIYLIGVIYKIKKLDYNKQSIKALLLVLG